jgi:hypothetical protein
MRNFCLDRSINTNAQSEKNISFRYIYNSGCSNLSLHKVNSSRSHYKKKIITFYSDFGMKLTHKPKIYIQREKTKVNKQAAQNQEIEICRSLKDDDKNILNFRSDLHKS